MILVDGSTYVVRDKVTAITRDTNGAAIFWVGEQRYLSVHSFEDALSIYNSSKDSEAMTAFAKVDSPMMNPWHSDPRP